MILHLINLFFTVIYRGTNTYTPTLFSRIFFFWPFNRDKKWKLISWWCTSDTRKWWFFAHKHTLSGGLDVCWNRNGLDEHGRMNARRSWKHAHGTMRCQFCAAVTIARLPLSPHRRRRHRRYRSFRFTCVWHWYKCMHISLIHGRDFYHSSKCSAHISHIYTF